MVDINWNAVYGFWLVAKHGSFAEAARALPRGSVQALHKRVRMLETKQNLDLRLLRSRGVKGVRLTEAGERLYECLNLAFRDFEKLASALREEASGKLEIVATSFVADYYIPHIIAAFSPKYPEVSIYLHTCGTPEVMSHLETSRADVGICSPMAGRPNLTATHACPVQVKLVTRSGVEYPQSFNTWRDVVKCPLILPDRTSMLRKAFDELMLKEGLEQTVQLRAELTTPQLSLEAVRAGLGVALTAVVPAMQLRSDDITVVCPPPGLSKLRLSVIRARNAYVPKYMSAFVETAIAVMSSMPRFAADGQQGSVAP